jgi:glyoxylase-like metal-dependent hydrolase (beta-lactamase superfamily II)
MSWFRTRELHPGVWLVAEPSHVNSWLVAGDDRAVLLDTGLGIVPIRPVAEALTDRPVSVLNTHAHFDHIGGNHEFEEIAIHELGAAPLEHEPPSALLADYVAYTRRLLAVADAYRRTDRAFLHLLSPDSDPRPFPEEFDPANWRILASHPTRTLRDGDTVDLGGRTLAVLHTPGHSPDSISLLDEHAGLLFAGDTINTGPIYAQLPDSDLAEFAASTRRLADLRHDVRSVLVHHFGRVAVEPAFLTSVAEAFEQLCTAPQLSVEATDCLGRDVREVRFAGFSVLLPAETEEEAC